MQTLLQNPLKDAVLSKEKVKSIEHRLTIREEFVILIKLSARADSANLENDTEKSKKTSCLDATSHGSGERLDEMEQSEFYE